GSGGPGAGLALAAGGRRPRHPARAPLADAALPRAVPTGERLSLDRRDERVPRLPLGAARGPADPPRPALARPLRARALPPVPGGALRLSRAGGAGHGALSFSGHDQDEPVARRLAHPPAVDRAALRAPALSAGRRREAWV